jgi:hypothetical protein
MTCHTETFAAAAEISTLQDVTDPLQSDAKTARKVRREHRYPRRDELMSILTDARARIDRINAPA